MLIWRAKMRKLTYEYVKDFFENNGCEMLDTHYQNAKTLINYKCRCGNISKINFNNFKSGKRCYKCRGTRKFSYDYVQQYFTNNGCELLEKEYKGCDIKMKYRCNCGDINEISFWHFQKGQRCKKCAARKREGDNNGNYNPNLTDEDRTDKRNSQEYRDWRRQVYEQHNYTCQKCLKRGGRLNAHHIEGYAQNKDLRIDINNGMTLCKSCHNAFHKKYGRKNNNKSQLDNFLD